MKNQRKMKKLDNIRSFTLENTKTNVTSGGIAVAPGPTYMFVTTEGVNPDGTLYSDVQCVGD